jgi:hypothetical protein
MDMSVLKQNLIAEFLEGNRRIIKKAFDIKMFVDG